MSEPFVSGNKVIYWYNCPIRKVRKKKSWTFKQGNQTEKVKAFAKADKFIDQLNKDIDSGNYQANDLKFCFALDALEKTYLDKYKEHLEDATKGLRPKTYQEYVSYLDVIRGITKDKIKIRGRKLPDFKCSEITPEIAYEISEVFYKNLKKHNNSKCWFKFEAACKLAIVKNMGMKINPVAMVDRSLHQSKTRTEKKKAPTKQEVDQFENYLTQEKNKNYNSWKKQYKTHFDYIYNKFSIRSGVRGCEIRAFTINDVNLDQGYVIVDKSHCGKTNHVTITKTQKSDRMVVLPDDIIVDLKNWINFLQTNEDFFPNNKKLLFPSMQGSYVNESNINNRTIKDNAIAAGLDPKLFSPHQFRRYNNSRRRAAGHNQDRIQAQMGHEDKKMSDLYTTTWENLDQDRKNINEIFA